MIFRAAKSRTRADGSVAWRIIIEDWQNGRRIDRSVPKDQLRQHGFMPEMTLDEARARASQLNAQSSLERREQRRKSAALARARGDHQAECAFLPSAFVQKFEDELRGKISFGDCSGRKTKKVLSHWKCAKEIIREARLEPSRWHRTARTFYGAFARRCMSLSYVAKVVWILNEWGYFLSEQQGQPFRPLSPPRGYDRSVIAEAFLGSGKKRKESNPLDPEALRSSESKFDPAQFRWLYVSEWFGLRPIEVDSLMNRDEKGMPTCWKVETDERGIDILHVYQSKLTSLPHEKRWKLIPVILPEQKEALEILRSGEPLKRPLAKTVQKYLGEGVRLYGGRKAFESLMLDRGQSIEHVYSWMGHQSVDTLWKSYRNRMRARYRLPLSTPAEAPDRCLDPVA